MPPRDDLRESRGRLEQAADNLLSDLQCPHERFVYLVAHYLSASQGYGKALLAARETVSPETAEAYAEEARFFSDQTQLIGLLLGYRKRLGFGDKNEEAGEAPADPD